VLATFAIAAGLAVRRRSPIASIVLALIGFVAFQPLGLEVNDNVYASFFGVLFLLFSFGLHEPRARVLLGGVVFVFACNILSLAIDAYPSTVIDAIFGGFVIAGGPILLGRVIANRSRLNAALVEKTERLRRDRADQAEQAAAEERARIAGELHDVVAHAMSAMVVQAGGARRLAEKDPARARAAFAAVEETGREALTEIRRLLGVLRHQDDEIALAPQPSLRHLGALLRRVEAAGLPIELQVDGVERPLPPGVDLTAYRLVQAALGDALERGGAGRAEVRVRYRADGVDLDVTDDGTGARPLAGVRERVGLYGGQLHAGRRRSGGHAVRAKLPVGGAT
jgi:signal transduction histidine kinase